MISRNSTNNQRSNLLEKSAVNRLQKDWIEIQSNPLDTVYAEPFQNNLFHWYATLLAPNTSKYYGIVIALEFKFPFDYPHSPPEVRCHSPIHHSHVIGSWICLDMLQTHYSSEHYMGWSSSYSCLSILLQLQAFLLEEEDIQQIHIESDISNSRSTRIQETGHWPCEGKIYPMAPHWDVEEVFNSGLFSQRKRKLFTQSFETSNEPIQKKSLIEKQDESGYFVGGRILQSNSPLYIIRDIPNEILINIFSYLLFQDLKRVERVCKTFQQACDCKYLTLARELICFHSKHSFKEDTLGIGFDVENVKEISTPLDLISKSAFYQDGVRKGVWGQYFNNWIPIFINKKHANFQDFKSSMEDLIHYHPKLFQSNNGRVDLERADAYVELLCKLMNSMVVQIMKGYSHASIKALYGYLYFHRWLIFLMEEFPDALSEIDNEVKNFINDEKCRSKRVCPNIGEFLPKLTILGPSGLTWNSIKSAVIDETGVRNARWVLQKHPYLANINNANNNSQRCRKSWEENKVSCRLIMFHVFFLRNIVESYGNISLNELGRLYDVNFGCPPKTKSGISIEDLLQREVFKIQKVESFEEFFEYVGFGDFSSSSSIAQFLKDCVKKSERLGYHNNETRNQNHHGRGYDRYY